MYGRREVKKEPKPSPKTKVSREDLESGAVQRWVLSETLQHHATILPGAGAVVSGLYLGAFGLSSAGLGMTLLLVFASGSSWIYNYFIRGEKLGEERVSTVMKQLQDAEVNELEQLVQECLDGNFMEGAKEGGELLAAFRNFRTFLSEVDADGENASASRFNDLSRDALRQGVSYLRRAYSMWQAIQSVDLEGLEKELSQKRRKLSRLGEEVSAERSLLEQQIASHEGRINSQKSQQARLDEILVEIDQLDSALEIARLESVELVQQDAASFAERGTAASQLERAVAAAKRVEQKLRGSGLKGNASDAIYDTYANQKES